MPTEPAAVMSVLSRAVVPPSSLIGAASEPKRPPAITLMEPPDTTPSPATVMPLVETSLTSKPPPAAILSIPSSLSTVRTLRLMLPAVVVALSVLPAPMVVTLSA